MRHIIHGTSTLTNFIYNLSKFITEQKLYKLSDSKLRDDKNQEGIVLKQIQSPFFIYHSGEGIAEGYTQNNNLEEYIENIKYINNLKVLINISRLDKVKYKNLFEKTIEWLIIVSNYNDDESITDLITTTQLYYNRETSDNISGQSNKTLDFDLAEEILQTRLSKDTYLLKKSQKHIMPYYLNYKYNRPFYCEDLYRKDDNFIEKLKLNNKKHICRCNICDSEQSVYVDKSRSNLDKYIDVNIVSRVATQACSKCIKNERKLFEFKIPDSLNIKDKKELFYYLCKEYNWKVIDTRKLIFNNQIKYEDIEIPEHYLHKKHLYACPICNNYRFIYLKGHKHCDIDKLFAGIYDNDGKLQGVEISCENKASHFNSKNFQFRKDKLVFKAFEKKSFNKLFYYIVNNIKYYSKDEFAYIKENEILKFSIKELINSYD